MKATQPPEIELVIIVTPHFNLATTTAFLDPFRATNYLIGNAVFKWTMVSATGGEIFASNGLSVFTLAIRDLPQKLPNFVVVSSSWSPEAHHSSATTNSERKNFQNHVGVQYYAPLATEVAKVFMQYIGQSNLKQVWTDNISHALYE